MSSRAPLLTLVGACGVSACGSAMTLLALPWFVLQSTGSGTWTGSVTALQLVGLLASSVLAVPMVDR